MREIDRQREEGGRLMARGKEISQVGEVEGERDKVTERVTTDLESEHDGVLNQRRGEEDVIIDRENRGGEYFLGRSEERNGKINEREGGEKKSRG